MVATFPSIDQPLHEGRNPSPALKKSRGQQDSPDTEGMKNRKGPSNHSAEVKVKAANRQPLNPGLPKQTTPPSDSGREKPKKNSREAKKIVDEEGKANGSGAVFTISKDKPTGRDAKAGKASKGKPKQMSKPVEEGSVLDQQWEGEVITSRSATPVSDMEKFSATIAALDGPKLTSRDMSNKNLLTMADTTYSIMGKRTSILVPAAAKMQQYLRDSLTNTSLILKGTAGDGKTEGIDYHSVQVKFRDNSLHDEDITAVTGIRSSLGIRHLYQTKLVKAYEELSDEAQSLLNSEEPLQYVFKQGVVTLSSNRQDINLGIPSIEQFRTDLQKVWDHSNHGQAVSSARRRLEILLKKHDMHHLLNEKHEREVGATSGMDFYQMAKVDNHVHLAAAMTPKHLLRFIIDKYNHNGNDVVSVKDGKQVLLKDVFGSDTDKTHFSVDALSVVANEDFFQRFDHFNNAYSPYGKSAMRDAFLKIENYQKGLYFAEITSQIFETIETMDSNVYMEPRISVYGSRPDGWETVSAWACDHDLFHPRVAWMVQIPRIYRVLRKTGAVKNFQEMLANLWGPVFAATLEPEKYPKISKFLANVVAFDSVDDESAIDRIYTSQLFHPADWTSEDEPPYSFHIYYLFANIATVNALRAARGMNTFTLRPHCGESGPLHHLATAFICANSINHGIQLAQSPAMEYLYYLTQLGMSISPLSNNMLFCKLHDNPFAKFFKEGLNVTLSTDDPLQFHTSQEPLVEEYTISKLMYGFSNADLAEIARNSVIQSGFSDAVKQVMLGPMYAEGWEYGNAMAFSNIPDSRLHFRRTLLEDEYQFCHLAIDKKERPAKAPQHWTVLQPQGATKEANGSLPPKAEPPKKQLRAAGSKDVKTSER